MANTGRTNLLEEVGRIDAEKSNPNRRAEKRRVVGELNKGYKKGGRVGYKHGSYKTVPPSMGHSKYVTKEEDRETEIANKKANKSKKGSLVDKLRSPGPSAGRAGRAGRPQGGWTS